MSEALIFSTRSLGERERFDAYRSLYSTGADAILDGPDFSAEVVSHRLDRMLIFDRRLNDVMHERLAPRVRKDGFDHFTVQLNRSGGFTADLLHSARAVEPGEVVLFDMMKPMRTRVRSGHIVTCSVARHILEAEIPHLHDLHGFIIPAVPARLLADFMVALTRSAPNLPRDAMGGVGRALAALLGLGVRATREGGAQFGLEATPVKLDLARSFIDENLSDPELTPERIASATGLSRTILFSLFTAYGGVSKYIVNRRLARLRAALSRPSETRSVAALIYDVGFASESHANRAFREEFGLPPGRFRAELTRVGRPIPASAADWGMSWKNWVCELQ